MEEQDEARASFMRDYGPGNKRDEERKFEFHRRMMEATASRNVHKQAQALEEIIEKLDKRGSDALVFLLAKDGTLSRKDPFPGDTPYALEKGSRRYKTLKALVGCKSGGYCNTDDLAEGAECKPGEFRKACEELKGQFLKHFMGTTRKDIIDSKPRSGYRIHPQVRIIEME